MKKIKLFIEEFLKSFWNGLLFSLLHLFSFGCVIFIGIVYFYFMIIFGIYCGMKRICTSRYSSIGRVGDL